MSKIFFIVKQGVRFVKKSTAKFFKTKGTPAPNT